MEEVAYLVVTWRGSSFMVAMGCVAFVCMSSFKRSSLATFETDLTFQIMVVIGCYKF